MNIWMWIAIWLIIQNFFAGIGTAKHIRDFDTFDIVSYAIGCSLLGMFIWPIAVIKDLKQKKKEEKKKPPEENSIGFKTKAEIMAMEARKNES